MNIADTMEKDGKKYILIDIGRGQTMWKEVKPNKFILFIKSLFQVKQTTKH